MWLTANDRWVLQAAATAMKTWGGDMPHGARDWIAIRRLERETFIACNNDWADCQTCARPHEGPAYEITVWGWRALTEGQEEQP